jgi:hypothetical protein
MNIEEQLLKGEGETRTTVQKRVRKCCEYCGEYATYRYTYLLKNFRRNPASRGYGRDDCSWASDTEIYTCPTCQPETPEGHDSGWSRHTLGDGNHHMFLEWQKVNEGI